MRTVGLVSPVGCVGGAGVGASVALSPHGSPDRANELRTVALCARNTTKRQTKRQETWLALDALRILTVASHAVRWRTAIVSDRATKRHSADATAFLSVVETGVADALRADAGGDAALAERHAVDARRARQAAARVDAARAADDRLADAADELKVVGAEIARRTAARDADVSADARERTNGVAATCSPHCIRSDRS